MKIELTKNKKQKPNQSSLGFGKYFTDHMFIMEYENGEWRNERIVPYAPIAIDPATTVLHYGQGIFEGLKAYINDKGEMNLFRPKDNFARMTNSAEILCMPPLDEKKAFDGLIELLKIEKEWIPTQEGTSLYIRPTMLGVDEVLGVHASKKYMFYIILSPVGAYYANGLSPVKIYVEDNYVRAPLGGTGEAKCMGNYSASLKAGEEAKKKGFDQVLWLDAKDRKYIEEVGSMNIFFVINDEVVTPKLVGSILPGITRKSAIELLKSKGYKVSERRISIDEVDASLQDGSLKECFGTGTAAVISPVGTLNYMGKDYVISGGKMGDITKMLYDTLTGIQTKKIKDEFGWIVDVK